MTLFADLPGTFTLKRAAGHADYLTRNMDAVLVEQDLTPHGRYAGWVPVSLTFAAELDTMEPIAFEAFVESSLDRIFRPWRHHDEPDFLDFYDPVPRLSRALELVSRIPILLKSPRRRWDVLDDAAYIAARRLRRAADRLDERFEQRRTSR